MKRNTYYNDNKIAWKQIKQQTGASQTCSNKPTRDQQHNEVEVHRVHSGLNSQRTRGEKKDLLCPATVNVVLYGLYGKGW